MDKKDRQDSRDRIKVDSNDPSEVEYLHRQHKQYSHEQIVDAIKKHGPYRQDIEKYLKSGTK